MVSTQSFSFISKVLSDKGKRTVYDAGLFGLHGENDDEVSFIYLLFSFSTVSLFFLLVFFSFCIRILTLLKKTLEQGFCDFMQEMVCLMQREITQVFFVFPDDHFPVLKLINNELIVLEGKTIIPKSRIQFSIIRICIYIIEINDELYIQF